MRRLLALALAAGLAGCITHAPEDGSPHAFVQTNWERPGVPLDIRPRQQPSGAQPGTVVVRAAP